MSVSVKEHLRDILSGYTDIFGETESVQSFRIFMNAYEDLASRKNLAGHLTGSAIVWHKESNTVLRVYHAKLNVWVFSAGGHVDDGELPWQASIRELQEETGIVAKPLGDARYIPLLLDAHPIPTSVKKTEPAHWHYDVVYLYEVDQKPDLCLDPKEALNFRWEDVGNVAKAVDLSKQMAQYLSIFVAKQG